MSCTAGRAHQRQTSRKSTTLSRILQGKLRTGRGRRACCGAVLRHAGALGTTLAVACGSAQQRSYSPEHVCAATHCVVWPASHTEGKGTEQRRPNGGVCCQRPSEPFASASKARALGPLPTKEACTGRGTVGSRNRAVAKRCIDAPSSIQTAERLHCDRQRSCRAAVTVPRVGVTQGCGAVRLDV